MKNQPIHFQHDLSYCENYIGLEIGRHTSWTLNYVVGVDPVELRQIKARIMSKSTDIITGIIKFGSQTNGRDKFFR